MDMCFWIYGMGVYEVLLAMWLEGIGVLVSGWVVVEMRYIQGLRMWV